MGLPSLSSASPRVKIALVVLFAWLASFRLLGLRGVALGGVVVGLAAWWALSERSPTPTDREDPVEGMNQFAIGTIQHDRLVVPLTAPMGLWMPAIALIVGTVGLFPMFPSGAVLAGLVGAVALWFARERHRPKVAWMDSAHLALPGEWTLPLKGITDIRVDSQRQVVTFRDSDGQTRRVCFRGPVHPTAAARFRAVLSEAVSSAEMVTPTVEPESLRMLRERRPE